MEIKSDKELDCLGLYCPEPVFRTRMQLDNMIIGEILEIIADDPAAEADIRSLAKNLKQKILGVYREGKMVRIFIEKVK
jgi:TusA-related sulfurtransferase